MVVWLIVACIFVALFVVVVCFGFVWCGVLVARSFDCFDFISWLLCCCFCYVCLF